MAALSQSKRTVPQRTSVRHIMWWVNAALLPGIIMALVLLGAGYGLRLALAVILAISLEWACLHARQMAAERALDGSAVLTGLLVTLALPPEVPLGILATGVAGALLLGKHAFGGLGANPFNPAMVGYAIVLVSFPAQLAQWPHLADAVSAATPLELVSHRAGQTYTEVISTGSFGGLGGLPWQWINLAFAVGGVGLLIARIVRWRIPVAVLLGLAIPAALTFDGGSSLSQGSPLYHWFTGATMLTAFFIATDPVTHPLAPRAQWAFGLLVGLLIFVIRAYGAYPDGAAFAILLANAATPWLDARTPAQANER